MPLSMLNTSLTKKLLAIRALSQLALLLCLFPYHFINHPPQVYELFYVAFKEWQHLMPCFPFRKIYAHILSPWYIALLLNTTTRQTLVTSDFRSLLPELFLVVFTFSIPFIWSISVLQLVHFGPNPANNATTQDPHNSRGALRVLDWHPYRKPTHTSFLLYYLSKSVDNTQYKAQLLAKPMHKLQLLLITTCIYVIGILIISLWLIYCTMGDLCCT